MPNDAINPPPLRARSVRAGHSAVMRRLRQVLGLSAQRVAPAHVLAMAATTSAPCPSGPAGAKPAPTVDHDGAKPTSASLRAEARKLLEQLPVEIRDPISRGGRQATWTTIPERPSVHDLMLLTDAQFAIYKRVVELDSASQRLLAEEQAAVAQQR